MRLPVRLVTVSLLVLVFGGPPAAAQDYGTQEAAPSGVVQTPGQAQSTQSQQQGTEVTPRPLTEIPAPAAKHSGWEDFGVWSLIGIAVFVVAAGAVWWRRRIGNR